VVLSRVLGPYREVEVAIRFLATSVLPSGVLFHLLSSCSEGGLFVF